MQWTATTFNKSCRGTIYLPQPKKAPWIFHMNSTETSHAYLSIHSQCDRSRVTQCSKTRHTSSRVLFLSYHFFPLRQLFGTHIHTSSPKIFSTIQRTALLVGVMHEPTIATGFDRYTKTVLKKRKKKIEGGMRLKMAISGGYIWFCLIQVQQWI